MAIAVELHEQVRPRTLAHRAQALRELGKRSIPGTAGHLALFVFCEVKLPGAHGLSRPLVIAVVGLLLVLRVVAMLRAVRERGRPEVTRVMHAVGAVGMNVVWGILITGVYLERGFGDEAMIMGFVTCGVATGCINTLAPSRRLVRAALITLLVPLDVAALVTGGSLTIAVLHLLFLAFAWSLGSAAYREYWVAVHTQELLRAHADTERATADQLRAEIESRAKVETELRQAQKLEAIGRLAAGIAHEINTPIQYVQHSCGFVEQGVAELSGAVDDYRGVIEALAAARLTPEAALAAAEAIEADRDLGYLRAQLHAATERALEGLGRVAKIVAATKEFAYRDRSEMALSDLNHALTSTLLICHNETKYVADVDTDLGELPLVMCHAGELNQVVLNLVVNAAHAIADVVAGTTQRGTISVRTRHVGDRVTIEVSDTGGGIPHEHLDKIFEPFFTTKPVGSGTGQGLAIARSVVVDKHGGTIDVRSEVGSGTTFTISLPLIEI